MKFNQAATLFLAALARGECAAQSAGYSLERECNVVKKEPDPTKPNRIQTASPSEVPSSLPSAFPSTSPSKAPSSSPSAPPSTSPSKAPSNSPSAPPSADPGNQVAKLTAADGAASDQFGTSVAISGDTAIVGAYFDDDNGTINSGSAYIFEKVDGSWSQVNKLTAADGAPTDLFGYSVAISGDIAIAGAYFDDDNGTTNSGSAYIFEKVDGSWSQVNKLTAFDGATLDFFGFSVAISGGTAIVGARLDDDVDNGTTDSGSAYIFETPT